MSRWAGSCVTTTEMLRELAPKSRSIAMRLRLGGPRAETNALATTDGEQARYYRSSTTQSADLQERSMMGDSDQCSKRSAQYVRLEF
jgi:hypothetical protein